MCNFSFARLKIAQLARDLGCLSGPATKRLIEQCRLKEADKRKLFDFLAVEWVAEENESATVSFSFDKFDWFEELLYESADFIRFQLDYQDLSDAEVATKKSIVLYRLSVIDVDLDDEGSTEEFADFGMLLMMLIAEHG